MVYHPWPLLCIIVVAIELKQGKLHLFLMQHQYADNWYLIRFTWVRCIIGLPIKASFNWFLGDLI